MGDPSGFNPDTPRNPLQNEDEVFRILATGTTDEMESLRAFHKLTPEQLNHAQHYAKMRQDIFTDMSTRRDERVRNNPKPTIIELAMGVYREDVEPQVWDAVLALRAKGYETIASGFDGIGESQHMHFAKPIDGSTLPEVLVNDLTAEGIEISVSTSGEKLRFKSDRLLSIDELKSVWTRITDAMPDLGTPAGESMIQGAVNFRKKFAK